MKRLLGIRSAGHTGTLDPFATGLLPIVVGEAAKFARFLIDADKAYEATLRLGATSSTGDVEGDITKNSDISANLDDVVRVLADFRGPQSQRPPMHSAVRVGGKRLYDWAREGVEKDRPVRSITINAIELDSFSGENLVISVNCSKGTYIRVLAEDIGSRLGCGAYLTSLRRTAIGPLRIGQSVALSALEASDAQACRSRLLPAEVLVSALPRVTLDEAGARALSHGQRRSVTGPAPAGDCALFGPRGGFLGVAKVEGGGWVAVRLMGAPSSQGPDST